MMINELWATDSMWSFGCRTKKNMYTQETFHLISENTMLSTGVFWWIGSSRWHGHIVIQWVSRACLDRLSCDTISIAAPSPVAQFYAHNRNGNSCFADRSEHAQRSFQRRWRLWRRCCLLHIAQFRFRFTFDAQRRSMQWRWRWQWVGCDRWNSRYWLFRQ